MTNIKPVLHKVSSYDLDRFLNKNPFAVQNNHDLKIMNNLFLETESQSKNVQAETEFQNKQEADFNNVAQQIKLFKEGISDQRFRNLQRAFKKLVKNKDLPNKPSKELQYYYITESSIIDNFENLFSFKCDILAKMFYLKMAKNKDSARVNFF